ncbi:MAG: sigma-54 dependent transcriptional regulator [bacterium]
MARILVVDDDPNVLTTSSITLTREGHEVSRAESFAQVEPWIGSVSFDIVITDLRLEDGKTGLDVLKMCKSITPETCVIIITAFSSIESAIAAMRDGASDYLIKPCGPDQIVLSVDRVLERRALLSQIRSLQREVKSYREDEIIGKSPLMQRVLKTLSLVADTDTTVLITGETGTGKDLVAKVIHARSRLHDKPFMAISCAALPESLLESELFGHVKGAFSGAIINKKGLILEADGGTLFLDEIGEMSLPLQSKLLRFIEQGEVRPVGSNKNMYVKERLLAATNKDLAQAVRNKEFRSDLYYRLKVVGIHLPPLRERGQDVLLLATRFLSLACRKQGIPDLVFSTEAKALLKSYHWPGNVRELQHAIEGAVILAEGPVITDNHLDIPIGASARGPLSPDPADGLALTDITRQHLLDVLAQCHWNQKRAAEVLKISKATLWRKLKAYGINVNELRKSCYP